MANPFLGEIRAVSFQFAPVGWALCNGQLLSISQNSALFSLLGTQYGGDGRTTFGLPNLEGRVAINFGTGLSTYVQGETGGQETVQLTVSQIPNHHHYLSSANAPATSTSPASGPWGVPSVAGQPQNLYGSPTSGLAASDVIGPTGAGQAHENRQPFLTMNYIIALEGVYPARG